MLGKRMITTIVLGKPKRMATESNDLPRFFIQRVARVEDASPDYTYKQTNNRAGNGEDRWADEITVR